MYLNGSFSSLTQEVLVLRSVGRHQRGGPKVRSGGDRRDGAGQRRKARKLQMPQVEGRVAHKAWRPASDAGQTSLLAVMQKPGHSVF